MIYFKTKVSIQMLTVLVLLSIFRVGASSFAKCSKYDAKEILLETTSGVLSGSCDFIEINDQSSRFDRSGNVYSWLSVPYAEPPVGPNRFKSPVEVKARNETIDATKWPNSCIQLDRSYFDSNVPSFLQDFGGYEMWRVNADTSKASEDCLYLNIFVPNDAFHRNSFPRPGNSEPSSFPILVFFHGLIGSSALDIYNPSALVATTNTIVITVNYRLGIFGFLYLENEFPGNQALLDQNEALRWVKNNADKFGGDPNRITIGGQGTGAILTGYHLFYQDSWQYFRNMILHSGTPSMDRFQAISADEANKRARDVLASIGCLSENSTDSDAAACAQESVHVSRASLDYLPHVTSPFLPVIDGRVLTESPLDALRSGNFKRCPLITGFTTDEGSMFAGYSGLIQNIKTHQSINHTALAKFLKHHFAFYPSYPKQSNELLVNSILHEYTRIISEVNEDGILNLLAKPSYFPALSKILGDYMFKCPAYKFVDLLAKQNSQVFVYLYAHRISSTPWPTWYGATHGDDLAFLFAHPLSVRESDSFISLNPWASPPHRYSNNEKNLNNEILNYWSSFIHNNNPNSRNSHKIWPQYSLLSFDSDAGNMTDPSEAGRYIILRSNGTKIGRSYSLETCQFWNSYLPALVQQNEDSKMMRSQLEVETKPCEMTSTNQPQPISQSSENSSESIKFNILVLCFLHFVVILNLF